MAILEVKTKIETKQAEKNVDDLSGKINKGKQSTDGMTNSLDKMSGGAITAFKSMVAGVKNGVLAMKSLKVAIAATGIGLLVLAVAGLVSYFKNTQQGADLLDKAFAGIGATVDVLIDRLSTFGGGIVEILSGNFSKGLDALAGSFKGITKEIKEEALAAVDLEEASQKLLVTKRNFIEQEAKLNADLQKYRLESENFDLSTADRLAANAKAQETALTLADKQTEIAKEELRILSEKNALGESLNADFEAEAIAKAKLFQIEGQRDKLSKGFQAKAKSITAEAKGAAATAAAEAKTAQDAVSAKQIADAKVAALAVENARLEALKQVDNQIREYKLINNEATLEDLLVFEEQRRALELEQLDLSEAGRASILLSYREKEAAANGEAIAKAAEQKTEAGNKIKADDQALNSIKVGLVSSGFRILQELAGKNEKAQKGIAAAQATFDTYAAIAGSLRAAQTSPGAAIPGYAIAQAVATGVFGLLQVKKILSTSTGGGTPSISGGGSSGGGARPSAETPRIPDFGSFNQGVGGGSGFQTNRAVVINQDIRDTNAMDNRINDLIKIGK
jgi:hypothetical protein